MSMQQPVSGRIKKLREEIAEISEANLKYVPNARMAKTHAEHERRLQRLQEIIDELLALTDWKKQ